MRKNTMHCKVITKAQTPVQAQDSKQTIVNVMDRLVDWQYQKQWGAYFPSTNDDNNNVN